MSLFLVFLEDDRSVVATEAEGVGQGGVDDPLLCLVEGKVETVVDFRIIRKMVDGGRNDIVLHGKD